MKSKITNFSFLLIIPLVSICNTDVYEPDEKPNVLFVSIDDLNDWVVILDGHPLVKTPNIDRLAGRGTTFMNAHVQSPLCNPSRTSVLTGLRPATTGIYGLRPWFRTLEEWKDHVTLPQNFKAHGYRTLTTGRVYHSNPSIERELEFDIWGPGSPPGPRPEERISSFPSDLWLIDWGVAPHSDEETGDYRITTWAIEQLKSMPEDEPFFMAAGYFLPHVPLFVTQKWFDLYPDDDSVLPPILENDRSDTPRFSWYLHWDLPEPACNASKV